MIDHKPTPEPDMDWTAVDILGLAAAGSVVLLVGLGVARVAVWVLGGGA